MAKSRTTDRSEQPKRPAAALESGSKVRIDQAHRSGSQAERKRPAAEPFVDEAVVDAAAGLTESTEDQVLTQATQLAALLQHRSRDLDRREANVNASAAKLEAEARSARLSLAEREATCHELETEIQARLQRCETQERDAVHREQELRQIDEQLREREQRLADSQGQLQAQTDAVENARRSLQAERAHLDDQLRTERRAISEEREKMLAEIQQEREALLHEIELTRDQDRLRLEQHQMNMIADVERQRTEVFELREQLEKSRADFEQSRLDLEKQRDSLIASSTAKITNEAFELAQERSWMEQERAALAAEQSKLKETTRQLTQELEHRQQEIEKLRSALELMQAERMAAAAAVVPTPAHVVAPPAVEPIAQEIMSGDAPQIVPMPSISLSELAEQRCRIDEAKAFLEREADELDQIRLSLAEEQAKWKTRFQEQQAELTRREKLLESEFEGRKNKLLAREKTLDQQLTTVEQTRQEILRVHRESLEMRLVAEELWAQIAGRVPSAEVSQSIAKLRSRLTSQYQQENQQLTAKRQQLVELSERLDQQHDALLRQRRELQAWAAARQLEIEQQAERLVKRELELDQQQEHCREQEGRWESESRRMQQELRQAKSRLQADAA